MILTDLLEGLSEKRILVVGDAGLDRYIHGLSSRLCPEAPVPVFTPTRVESRAGLAGNVSVNVSSLGAQVKLCTIIGDDQNGVDLCDALDQAGVLSVERYIVKDAALMTTTKNRYVCDWHLLLRVDEEIPTSINPDKMERFISGVVREAREWADAIVVQDYGKGIVTARLMRELVHCAGLTNKPLIVDPSAKQDPSIYAGVTFLKPNTKEIDEIKRSLGIVDCVKIKEVLNIHGLLVTRGSSGMDVFGVESGLHIAARRREVHDVCGAGDTVTAVFALGIASGVDIFEAAYLANMAASIVVGKFGTATVTQEELAVEMKGVING